MPTYDSKRLQDLRDVSSAAPSSGQVPVWNATTSTWEPGSVGSQSTGRTSITFNDSTGTTSPTYFDNLAAGHRFDVGEFVFGSADVPVGHDATGNATLRLLMCNQSQTEPNKTFRFDVDYRLNPSSGTKASSSDGTLTNTFDIPTTSNLVWFEDFNLGTIADGTVSVSLRIIRETSDDEPTSSATGLDPIVCLGSYIDWPLN